MAASNLETAPAQLASNHHRSSARPFIDVAIALDRSWETTIGGNLGASTLERDATEVRHTSLASLRDRSSTQLTPTQDDDENTNDRHHQRRRTDYAPPPSVLLRRNYLALADSPLRRWAEEVQGVARLVADHHDDDILCQAFLTLTMQLLAEQPLKTPFVAAVVLILNTLKPDIVEQLLARVASALEDKIKTGDWREVKLYLKFLGCVQSCLEGDGVFPLLEELFSRAADLQTASSDDVSIQMQCVCLTLLTL